MTKNPSGPSATLPPEQATAEQPAAKVPAKKAGHIRLTSHSSGGKPLQFPIDWGAPTARERGPIIGSITAAANRNVIGAYGGAYSIYRALAVSSGTLNPIARPDLKDKVTVPDILLQPHSASLQVVVYDGNQFPQRYRNGAFTSNLHGHRINYDSLHQSGSGYVAKHQKDFLFANDEWFRGLELKYNKHYIGMEVAGSPMNFVTFIPLKAHVIMTIKVPQTTETDELLDEAGIKRLTYESQWRQYRLRIESSLDDKQRQVMLPLIRQARENFGKSA
jgi:hypothetical protein